MAITNNQPNHYTQDEIKKLHEAFSAIDNSAWFIVEYSNFASVNMDGEFTLDELKAIVAAIQAVVDKRKAQTQKANVHV